MAIVISYLVYKHSNQSIAHHSNPMQKVILRILDDIRVEDIIYLKALYVCIAGMGDVIDRRRRAGLGLLLHYVLGRSMNVLQVWVML